MHLYVIKNINIENYFEFKETKIVPSKRGIDITDLVLRTKEIINYEQYIKINKRSLIDLKINFSLRGESSFWIFLRTNEKFDEFTSIIRINKLDKCKKIFISFGTFINDDSEPYNKINLKYSVFSTQQLIEISSIYNNYIVTITNYPYLK